MKQSRRVARALVSTALAACSLAIVSASAAAGDHFYCSTVAAASACTSGTLHTYGKNNVAYDGPSLSWCESLVDSPGPSPFYYSNICVSGQGGGYTIYGTWRDWCAPCSWQNNNSTSLYDYVWNLGSNSHTFRAHSYW
jgi:hypothetical protein